MYCFTMINKMKNYYEININTNMKILCNRHNKILHNTLIIEMKTNFNIITMTMLFYCDIGERATRMDLIGDYLVYKFRNISLLNLKTHINNNKKKRNYCIRFYCERYVVSNGGGDCTSLQQVSFFWNAHFFLLYILLRPFTLIFH